MGLCRFRQWGHGTKAVIATVLPVIVEGLRIQSSSMTENRRMGMWPLAQRQRLKLWEETRLKINGLSNISCKETSAAYQR